MRHAIADASRFTEVIDRCGVTQLVRDKATLRNDVLEHLKNGRATQRQLLVALHTSLRNIRIAVASLEVEGAIESFYAISERRRLDVFWRLPVPPAGSSTPTTCFRAAETLAAMQRHAARLATGGVTL